MAIYSVLSTFVHPKEVLLSEQFNFGHREVLLAANNMDLRAILLASVPHGWGLDSNIRPYPIIRKKNLKPYPILAWSKSSQEKFIQGSDRKVFITGSPWAHLLKSIQVNPRDFKNDSNLTIGNSRKLLYLPSHSIHGGSVEHLTSIDQMRKAFGVESVTVCLFWLDFVNPKTRIFYEQQGCKLVCVGYKGASGFETPWTAIGGRIDFLPNLYKLFSEFSLIAMDEVSTPFWYALSLGKAIAITEDANRFTWTENHNPTEIVLTNENSLERVRQGLSSILKSPVIEATNEILELALSEIGWDYTQRFTEVVQDEKLLFHGLIDQQPGNSINDFISQTLQIS
jgi:hypothetical protein